MNYLVMYSKLVSPYYIWNHRFVIACQNFHFWTKNGSTHLDSHYSNNTNWLHFRPTLHIHFQNKKQKYFLTNQKSSSQLQLTIYFWATPTPYKLPSIQLHGWKFIWDTTVICLSLSHFGWTLAEDTYSPKPDTDNQRQPQRHSRYSTQQGH